jgi:acyl-CoA synthetase (AMP-forming)/AMP-acid ligase II
MLSLVAFCSVLEDQSGEVMLDFLHSRCLQPQHSGTVVLHLSEPDLAVTYDALAAAVSRMADVFKRCGLGRGSRLAIAATPTLEFVASLLAASRIGSAVAPMDVSLRGFSFSDYLGSVAPDAIIGPAAVLMRAPEQCARVRVVFDVGHGSAIPVISGVASSDDGSWPFQIHGAEPGDAARARQVSARCRPTDDALLIATSGSTGAPKLVRLSHAAVLFNIREHLASLGLSKPFSALQGLGLSYSYGLISSFLSPLAVGGTVVLPARTDQRSLCNAISSGHPTVSLMTPALIEHLLNNVSPEQLGSLRRLEKLGIGGDACPEWLRHKIAEMLPATAPYVTYGATEAGPRIATLPPADFLTRPSSVGLALNGIQLAVVDGSGHPVDAGETGRLLVRTPSRMSGYLGLDGAGSEWLDIGDIASLDEQGYLNLHGRAGRAFKYRGRMFDPAQVERVIMRLPSVLFSRVEPGAQGGGLQALVYYRIGQGADIQMQILRHCRRNLPSRLIPSQLITVAEADASFFKGRRLHFGSATVDGPFEAKRQGRA